MLVYNDDQGDFYAEFCRFARPVASKGYQFGEELLPINVSFNEEGCLIDFSNNPVDELTDFASKVRAISENFKIPVRLKAEGKDPAPLF